ncbi:hypothetical protein GCM10022214_12540 [Actinomadura miaoliensis]|uniref:Uncharacterized protein n=1 Tax=Actinomadura miaoliensis TaxID=430685 RepID=A0ABP7V8R7_9ACTN
MGQGLFTVAYEMPGSAIEDVPQETCLHWVDADPATVREPASPPGNRGQGAPVAALYQIQMSPHCLLQGGSLRPCGAVTYATTLECGADDPAQKTPQPRYSRA